jgi:hypothetical protein
VATEYLKVTGDVSGFKTHLQVKQKWKKNERKTKENETKWNKNETKWNETK